MNPSTAAETASARVGVIIASTRQDRFGPVPAQWIAALTAKRDNLDVEVIDLADYDLPAVLGGNDFDAPPPPTAAALSEKIQALDAFIIVTPVYNRSYPASLKLAIDWLFEEWAVKPVGIVSYGGVTGGQIAAEHLRGVFIEFKSVPLASAVLLPNFWTLFDHDGLPFQPDELAGWAAPMLDELTWWALSLREARQRRPYPGLDPVTEPAQHPDPTPPDQAVREVQP